MSILNTIRSILAPHILNLNDLNVDDLAHKLLNMVNLQCKRTRLQTELKWKNKLRSLPSPTIEKLTPNASTHVLTPTNATCVTDITIKSLLNNSSNVDVHCNENTSFSPPTNIILENNLNNKGNITSSDTTCVLSGNTQTSHHLIFNTDTSIDCNLSVPSPLDNTTNQESLPFRPYSINDSASDLKIAFSNLNLPPREYIDVVSSKFNSCLEILDTSVANLLFGHINKYFDTHDRCCDNSTTVIENIITHLIKLNTWSLILPPNDEVNIVNLFDHRCTACYNYLDFEFALINNLKFCLNCLHDALLDIPFIFDFTVSRIISFVQSLENASGFIYFLEFCNVGMTYNEWFNLLCPAPNKQIMNSFCFNDDSSCSSKPNYYTGPFLELFKPLPFLFSSIAQDSAPYSYSDINLLINNCPKTHMNTANWTYYSSLDNSTIKLEKLPLCSDYYSFII